jgi:hypothetical protein
MQAVLPISPPLSTPLVLAAGEVKQHCIGDHLDWWPLQNTGCRWFLCAFRGRGRGRITNFPIHCSYWLLPAPAPPPLPSGYCTTNLYINEHSTTLFTFILKMESVLHLKCRLHCPHPHGTKIQEKNQYQWRLATDLALMFNMNL